MMWVGTSGYNYPEWKGTFYPETLSASKMLPYYAARFTTVEINYTFYRTPTEKILQGWDLATPENFRLTLKAPRRITHDARLKECGDEVRRFIETAATLGPKLGVLLFQLPPNLKKDAGGRNLALCIADSERLSTPVEITADYGYFRLRDEGYTPSDIDRWGEIIKTRTAECGDTYVYFKHEESGKGPEFARLLIESLAR